MAYTQRCMSSRYQASVAVVSVVLASWSIACSSDDGKPTGPTGTSGTVADASAEVGSEAGTGLKKNAEQGCTVNGDCESNTCFIGGNQSFCSVPCTVANQASLCVPPFTGTCNRQGFCKRD